MKDGGRALSRVLVLTYACHPSEGSEAGAGWQSVLAAAEVSEEVWVVTRAKNAPDVVAGLEALHLDRRVNVLGIDRGKVALQLKQRVPFGTQLYYLAWQRTASRRIRALDRAHSFQVAHHATFAVDWMPTALTRSGIPFVWGPVGGSSFTPPRLWRWLGARGVMAELSRRMTVSLGHRISGRRAARASGLVLAQNNDVARTFKTEHVRVCPNVAVDSSILDVERHAQRLVAVGRLIPLKGWALAIDALATTDANFTLTFLGDGQDRKRLVKRARRVGVGDRVNFLGDVPRDEVAHWLATSSALVFPSFHDSAGWAVAEALALGCPVVSLDLAGPRVLMDRAQVSTVASNRQDLVGRLGMAFTSPPPPGPTDVWTIASFRSRLVAALLEVAGPERASAE